MWKYCKQKGPSSHKVYVSERETCKLGYLNAQNSGFASQSSYTQIMTWRMGKNSNRKIMKTPNIVGRVYTRIAKINQTNKQNLETHKSSADKDVWCKRGWRQATEELSRALQVSTEHQHCHL